MNRLIVGTIVTVIIGGTAYTVSQTDLINFFAEDTGLTQQQAEQYINTISDDEMVPFDELGDEQIDIGQETLNIVSKIDCIYSEYEWESSNLTCLAGKTQLSKIGKDEIALGKAYKKLGSNSASRDDILKTIELIDTLNDDFAYSIVISIFTQSEIDEIKKVNSFNKAILKAAIEDN